MMPSKIDIPVNFIHREASDWADVADDSAQTLDSAALAPRIRFGPEIWIVQAFLAMRARGYSTTLTDHLRKQAINVLHADHLSSVSAPWNHFIVSVRADRDPCFVTQIEIVQNQGSVWSKNDIYLPHWPQPGLIPRESERLGRVERIVYMGHPWNLAPELQNSSFLAALKEIGVELEIRDENWWDYRGCDVALAVRPGAPFYLATKPASKLVNAWLAGCPAILGKERGYTEVRESPLDFFEAGTAKGVLASIRELRANPTLERRMVQHGAERAKEFTAEKVADHWEKALTGPIRHRFIRWTGARVSRHLRRTFFSIGSIRRRIWGYQTVQETPSRLRKGLNSLRRALTAPPSLRTPG